MIEVIEYEKKRAMYVIRVDFFNSSFSLV